MGPENRTVSSKDNFLKVKIIGDFAGYTNIPSFEDFYLVIPRQVCLLHRYIMINIQRALVIETKMLITTFFFLFLASQL